MIVKRNKLPTIVGVVFLVLGTFLGVLALNYRQVFRLGAQGNLSPKDIRVSNISDTSATISWVTDTQTIGSIYYGDSESITQTAVESTTSNKSLTHSITVSGLDAQTEYFYKIGVNDTKYDNQGIAWRFTTGSNIGTSSGSRLISGSVLTALGEVASNALVYVDVSGYLLSTTTSNTGNFVVQLSNTRTSNLNSFQIVDPNSTLLQIFVQNGLNESSTVQIYPKSANPIPPIILGQTYDFRNAEANSEESNPDASLLAPENENLEVISKLTVEEGSATTSEKTVTLESIDEKEIIGSQTPEFSGTAAAGEEITILVESENPMEGSVKASSSGSWKWSPPDSLAPGSHKVTITWIDASGITRKLIRNFEVQASEVVPAFEASSSATLASSSPTPTTSATASAKPTITATATSAPVPETGSLTPTYLMSIIGAAMFLFSLSVWKLSENEH